MHFLEHSINRGRDGTQFWVRVRIYQPSSTTPTSRSMHSPSPLSHPLQTPLHYSLSVVLLRSSHTTVVHEVYAAINPW